MSLRLASLLRVRLVALTRLVLVALAVSVVPHLDAASHDTDGDLFAVVHDHSAHRIHDAPASTPDAASHCAICHVGRTFGAAPDAHAVHAPDSAVASAGPAYESVVPRRVAFSLPPLRSPPLPVVRA